MSDQAQMIRLRRKAGQTVESIAKAAGVSIRRVYQILGPTTSKPRATDKQIADVKARAARGQALRQISAETGMSRKTVSKIVGDIRPAAAPLTTSEVRTIRRRAAAGHSPSTIARDLSRSTEGVRAALKREQLRDEIRDQVADKMRAEGMTPERLALATDDQVTVVHLTAWLSGERALATVKLQHVLRALGGKIQWR